VLRYKEQAASMVLQTYVIDVPYGWHVRTPSIYKLKTLDPDYIEIRGRLPKIEYETVGIDKEKCTPKELKAYHKRCHYIKRKNEIDAKISDS